MLGKGDHVSYTMCNTVCVETGESTTRAKAAVVTAHCFSFCPGKRISCHTSKFFVALRDPLESIGRPTAFLNYHV